VVFVVDVGSGLQQNLNDGPRIHRGGQQQRGVATLESRKRDEKRER
jgi:hypothetical protein